jgi:hypothetical protein
MKSKWLTGVAAVLGVALLAGCAGFPGKKTVEYEQVITVLKPIERVSVIVSYQGGVFYRVQVNNGLPYAISLQWDESSYVNTGGESVRLIRIPDRNDLPEQPHLPQADSPIAPGSRLLADFAGESWLKLARRGVTPKPKEGFRKARIYLVFNIKGKTVDWQGEVVFVPKRRP